jgi:hypothetical protein
VFSLKYITIVAQLMPAAQNLKGSQGLEWQCLKQL